MKSSATVNFRPETDAPKKLRPENVYAYSTVHTTTITQWKIQETLLTDAIHSVLYRIWNNPPVVRRPMIRQPAIEVWTTGITSASSDSNTLQEETEKHDKYKKRKIYHL